VASTCAPSRWFPEQRLTPRDERPVSCVAAPGRSRPYDAEGPLRRVMRAKSAGPLSGQITLYVECPLASLATRSGCQGWRCVCPVSRIEPLCLNDRRGRGAGIDRHRLNGSGAAWSPPGESGARPVISQPRAALYIQAPNVRYDYRRPNNVKCQISKRPRGLGSRSLPHAISKTREAASATAYLLDQASVSSSQS
jgi:hypothetical protein